MRLSVFLATCFLSFLLYMRAGGQAGPGSPASSHALAYTADGRLLPVAGYREWIYLTSGLDMNYAPSMSGMDGHSMFGNVFVNPESWRTFSQTGAWPDKTALVLEERGAERSASINKAGQSQGEDVMALEVHVKDASRGGWAFYAFNGDAPARKIPLAADCYSCHRDHAAVDTTFVQFYPTLLPIAKQKGTLSSNYRQESRH